MMDILQSPWLQPNQTHQKGPKENWENITNSENKTDIGRDLDKKPSKILRKNKDGSDTPGLVVSVQYRDVIRSVI